VFIEARSAPPIACFVPSAKREVTAFHAVSSTQAMPTSSAPSTAQIAATFATSCTTGAGLPVTAGTNEWLAP
jgi:hypothetical protein